MTSQGVKKELCDRRGGHRAGAVQRGCTTSPPKNDQEPGKPDS